MIKTRIINEPHAQNCEELAKEFNVISSKAMNFFRTSHDFEQRGLDLSTVQ